MMTIRSTAAAAWALTLAGLGTGLTGLEGAEGRPNFVVILADDMGHGDMSAYNERSVWKTPNLDRLAAEGMLFQQGHAPAASCTPSRYGLLTGRYPHRTWLKSGVVGAFGRPMINPGETTIAEFLAEHGYATGFFGKWHLGMQAEGGTKLDEVDYTKPLRYGPKQEGFQTSLRLSSAGNSPYVGIRDGMFEAEPTAKLEAVKEGETRVGPGPKDPAFRLEDVQQRVTEEAIGFIEREAKAGRPFFAYVAYSAPHHPMVPQERFRGKSGATLYGDFILELDHWVGELMAALDQAGVSKDTMVVFSADNGVPPDVDFAAQRAAGHDSTVGLRGIKMDLFEGGHRVPFVVRWPAEVAPGQTSGVPVGLTDLFATFADAAELKLPPDVAGDSVSLVPILEGQKGAGRPPLVVQGHHGTLALIDWPWKFMGTPDSGGLKTPPFQGSPEAAALPRFQLYNLAEDPGETTNRYPELAERADEMARELAAIVRAGRSTPGPDLSNEGGPVWKQVEWIKEYAP